MGIVSKTTSVRIVWSSYVRRGRRLANSRPSAELRGSLDEGDRILEGFYVSRADGTLQLLIYRAPIQLNIEIWEIYIYKEKQSKLKMQIRIASQERDQKRESGISPRLRAAARQRQP